MRGRGRRKLAFSTCNVFATFSLRFPNVFITEVGIAAAIHLKKHIATHAKGMNNLEKWNSPRAEFLSATPGVDHFDDDLGGRSDDDLAPIALMDEHHKEALINNEDVDNQGDNAEELAEGGAGDETSSEEDGEPSAESIDF